MLKNILKKKLIIFTGPSGVGKATIERELFKNKSLNLDLSISATTRKPRVGEKNGQHYYFITEKDFNQKIKNNEFIEYSQHFSSKYGTLKSEIKRIHENGKVPFLEVETVGAKNIVKQYSSNEIISIFVAPPSIEKLRHRIVERGTETSSQIEERLERVKLEMADKNLFDYVVYNDLLDHTIEQIAHILKKGLQ